MSIDPVTLAVVENGLNQVCSEMDLVHTRTSFSPVISEAFDRSNGIYHPRDGRIIAQGALGLPLFLGVMQFTTQAVMEHCPDLRPGDVIVLNDPYRGGTHLMDVKMLMPFFYEGKLWCYLANTGHWPDIGGMVPGGFSSTATEIQQEGLRLPPVKLVREGELCQDVVDIILHNVRVPEERIGDLRAQIGALKTGEKRLKQMLDRYGTKTVEESIEELYVRAEQHMRRCIDTVPDGTYSFTSYVDSDGVDNRPLEIALDMTVQGSDITFDFSRSSPPCRGPMNSVWATTQSAVYVGMKHVFPEVPINAGCFAPLHIPEPDGTFLYAKYPRPVAGCAAEVSQRIIEAVFGAMALALPQRMFAAPAGTSGNLSLGGYDTDTGRHYIMYQFTGGGYGGTWESDGLTNGCSAQGISKSQPIEIMEQHYPLIFEEYALREESGGAGRHRGGFGVTYRLRMLRGEGTASFVMDHGLYGPPGALGGEPGARNEIEVHQGDQVSSPPHCSKGDGYVLRPGDRIQVRTPGGGGYGPPSERSAEQIKWDVRQGYYPASGEGGR